MCMHYYIYIYALICLLIYGGLDNSSNFRQPSVFSGVVPEDKEQ